MTVPATPWVSVAPRRRSGGALNGLDVHAPLALAGVHRDRDERLDQSPFVIQRQRVEPARDGLPGLGIHSPDRLALVIEAPPFDFDGVQGSTRYPGGVALRFARVLRYRDDKRADEADTIDTVREFYARG